MQVIMDHLADRITATQAAQELGVSRKTYYEWLDRARTAMYQSLMDRPTGRPQASMDEEKEQLRNALKAMEKERTVMEGRLRIHQVIQETLDELEFKSQLSKKKGTEAS